MEKISNCSVGLLQWGGNEEKDLQEKIKHVKSEINILQAGIITDEVKLKLSNLEGELILLLEQENIFWKQRAKQHWYRDGDRDTSFFHTHAQRRREINQIISLKDMTCINKFDENEIENIILNHFGDIFTSSTPSPTEISKALLCICNRVNNMQRDTLMLPFTVDEIFKALKQMHPFKSPGPDAHADNFAAKRMRKIGQRRAVDYTSTVVRYVQLRMFQRDSRERTVLQPTPAAAIDMLPTAAYLDNPSTSFAAKFVHTSLNKNRCSINRVLWTPSGRRLITGSQSGELTLWNGQSFNFEMILQAHEQAVRSMVWSYNENWMVTGDDGGSIKYWQNSMNNVKANKSAHKESVRGLSFCRTDLKFCSCSDDTTVKVWDFARCQEERSLSGHGWDVKCVDWHPTKSLLVSGGKDNLVKLWDAKSERELCSFHGHKNTVLCVKWNQNGNWVLTASKDQIIKLYDIRAMKELESFRGHRKDVTALAWHPFHEEYFVSGSFDGSIIHWLVGHETPQIEIQNAHDNSVWDLAWHPIGYLLCSGGNDHATKFWCRNRPGDSARDKSNMGPNQGFGEQSPAMGGRLPVPFQMSEPPTTPGPFGPGLARYEGTIPGIGAAMPLAMQSIDSSAQGEQKPPMSVSGPPPLPPGPHPSLLAGKQQQPYQQNASSVQQHQSLPQQMSSMPPQNMAQMQPPSHLPLLPHPHLSRPPPHLQSLNTSGNVPSSMPGSMPVPSMPSPNPGQMPGPMGIQGVMNQMVPPLPQGHFMPMNSMPSGSGPPGNMPPGSNQMYQPGGAFNRPQAGQMPMMPGLNPYQQSGNPNAPVMPSNFNLPSGMHPPLPPGPPPHGQTHQ